MGSHKKITEPRETRSQRTRRAGSRRAGTEGTVPVAELIGRAQEKRDGEGTQHIPIVDNADEDIRPSTRLDHLGTRSASVGIKEPRAVRVTDKISPEDKRDTKKVQDYAVTAMSVIVTLAAILLTFTVAGMKMGLILVAAIMSVVLVSVGVTMYLSSKKPR